MTSPPHRYIKLPPLELIQMYSCTDCGAVSADRAMHDLWHQKK